MSTQYLMDMSAWARLGNPRLSQARSDEIADAMLAGRIHACAPFLLEFGMTAVNQRDYASIMSMARAAMPYVALSDDIAKRGGVPFAHEWLGSARTLG